MGNVFLAHKIVTNINLFLSVHVGSSVKLCALGFLGYWNYFALSSSCWLMMIPPSSGLPLWVCLWQKWKEIFVCLPKDQKRGPKNAFWLLALLGHKSAFTIADWINLNWVQNSKTLKKTKCGLYFLILSFH